MFWLVSIESSNPFILLSNGKSLHLPPSSVAVSDSDSNPIYDNQYPNEYRIIQSQAAKDLHES